MILESFSAGYWLAPELSATEYGGKCAIIQDTVFEELIAQTGDIDPQVMVGGRQFPLYPERGMPSHIVAIPEEDSHSQSVDAVLVLKPGRRLVAGL